MFLMQSANLLDLARTLGLGRREAFWRVALPLARPAIAVGLTLALFEAVNDIGAAEFLGVRTLTVSVYTTWVTRSDLPGAAQIALAMVVVALALLSVERYARRRRRYANDAQHPRPLARQPLPLPLGLAALAATLVPIAAGFLIPVSYLVDESLARVQFAGMPTAVVGETITTVTLAGIATALTVSAGLLVAYAGRLGVTGGALCARAASIGYALPGTVLAIGVLPVVTGIEGLFDAGLFLIGSGAALIYAYGARFMALAVGSVEAGFSRVSPSLDAAARTLGEGPMARLWRLHLPLARPALATAALLVFVDVMKELPATLLLRPVGVETLATHLYGEAVRGTYEDAAIAALLIVAAGLAPVVVLARVSRTAAGADRIL
jgi:iron(III) transport system permease protein